MNADDPALPALSIARSLRILALFVLIQIVVGSVVLTLSLEKEEWALAVGYFAVVVPGAWSAARLRRLRMAPEAFDLRLPPLAALLALVAGGVAVLFGLAGPILSLIPAPEENWMAEMASQTGAWTFLAFVLGAPVFEELLFRGVLLDGLLRGYSPGKAILVSSLLFGAAHLNPWQLVTGTLIGIYAGWVYYRSRSLLGCVAIHMGANGSAFVLRLFMDVDPAQPAADASLVESYGGAVPFAASTVALVVVLLFSVRFLKKRYDAIPRPAWVAG